MIRLHFTPEIAPARNFTASALTISMCMADCTVPVPFGRGDLPVPNLSNVNTGYPFAIAAEAKEYLIGSPGAVKFQSTTIMRAKSKRVPRDEIIKYSQSAFDPI